MGTKKSILTIDDDPNNISIFHEILKDDYELFVATCGEDGLSIIQERCIDLVLLDVVMPGMDGFSVCKQIRADLKFMDVVIIFVTSADDPNEESYGLEIGAQDYVHKPISAAILKSRVRTHLAMAAGKLLLSQQNQKLTVLNEEKNKMLGMAAHDLRTPIGLIMGLCELIEPSILDSNGQEFLRLLNQQANLLLRLLNSILDLSSLENLHVTITKTEVSVTAFLRDQIKLFKNLAHKKNITIEELYPNEVSAQIDVSRLNQVFSNFVTNAIKYSPLGKSITIECGQNEREFWISVKDQGQGISLENQKLLFEPFKTLGSKTTAGETSTGLGLAICKKIVDAHDGRIEVHSILGEGSDFRVYLPYK